MSPIKKTSAVHIVLPTIAPLILVVGVGPVTMLFVQRYDLQAAPIILIVWCLALAATGFWMTKVLFESSKISVPSVAAVEGTEIFEDSKRTLEIGRAHV